MIENQSIKRALSVTQRVLEMSNYLFIYLFLSKLQDDLIFFTQNLHLTVEYI